MAIYRNHHNGNFTQIDNAVIRNHELSRRARGLLIEMLSYPKDWKFTITFLASTGKEKRGAIRTMLDELEEFGHVICEKFRNEKGRFDSRYTVCETPCKDNSIFPEPPAEKNVGNKNRCGQSETDKPKRKNEHGIPLLCNKKRVTKKDSQRESEKPANSENQRLGRYKNISLTPDEYKSLTERYGKYQTDRSIEVASEYGHMNGRCYAYERMDKWIRQDTEKANSYWGNNYEKSQSHKSDSGFDASEYERICVNNYNVVGWEPPTEEEEKKRKEEEWKRREQEKIDAHFEEMLTHIYSRAGGTA